jgi:predicted nucleic acid-binding protein
VILVDTSVWVGHLRAGDGRLARLLDDGEVACHPFVVGELACGGLKNRDIILGLMNTLPAAAPATHEEVMRFLDLRGLWGKGLGYVDVHLLASTALSGLPLWTLDRRLDAAAAAIGCAYR